ncbi:MAG: transketolase, partial [Acidobacteriota bacterium]|nr:transketolase [Acidobacteriota bacterium]
LPLGAAPLAYVLWQRHLRHDPSDPGWPDRDRFVLSAGHGSMLLYSLLHLSGYPLTLDDIRSFRQWGSLTPGHPEAHLTPGVEATTGPLGQGCGVAVGMAIAERMLAHRYNEGGHEIFGHHTYALVSDGDLMEGLAAEAASLAGHLQLGKLIYLYDSNDVSLDGPTSLTFTEDPAARFRAYGWQVLTVDDGDSDLASIDKAIAAARADSVRPSLVVVRTTIGFGSPNKSGSCDAHGAPLGEDEVRLTKEALGWDPGSSFHVPDDARERFAAGVRRGRRENADWRARLDAFVGARPVLADELRRAQGGRLPEGWDADLPGWDVGQKIATRVASGMTLQALAEKIPWLVGGDADLSGSTKSRIETAEDFDGQTGAGRNLHFGVREHAMGAICNGMAYHGGLRPYAATFLQFADYMRPTLRLAAMDGLPVVYVWTHDSVALGEDGPTHQPIEHVTALRAIPELHVVRPADANEACAAWRHAVTRSDSPTALILTRQGVPVLPGTRETAKDGVARGAYVLSEAEGGAPRAIVIATGSEVALALEAQRRLAEEGVRVRVVSMPCWEAFEAQPASYRASVLPAEIAARVSVEAGTTLAWRRYVGDFGRSIGVDRFGASAPGAVVMEQLGLTPENVAAAVKELL